jgi:hypothetical protein
MLSTHRSLVWLVNSPAVTTHNTLSCLVLVAVFGANTACVVGDASALLTAYVKTCRRVEPAVMGAHVQSTAGALVARMSRAVREEARLTIGKCEVWLKRRLRDNVYMWQREIWLRLRTTAKTVRIVARLRIYHSMSPSLRPNLPHRSAVTPPAIRHPENAFSASVDVAKAACAVACTVTPRGVAMS